MSIIIFLLILGALVLIHEFGHYIIAKKNNVLVEEFGIGFPPRLWGKKVGETLYSINLIPLGGFVKLHGEEYNEIKVNTESKSQKKRAFVFQKPHIKAAIITGGVIMNLVLGITIYYIILSINGFQSDAIPLIKPYQFRFGSQQGRVVVTAVQKDSPAAKAQLSPEDLIIKYQISPIMYETAWKSVNSASELISIIKNSQGKTVFLYTESVKNGVKKTIQVIPKYNPKLKRAVIGIGLLDTAIISYKTPIQKVFSGFFHSYNIMTYNYSTIAFLFQSAVMEKNAELVTGVVSGPIGIFSVVSDIVKTSGTKLIMNILNITALLSLSLAFMNILPFPALDGGRFVFVLYEWVSKKPINKTVEQYANLGGFIFLILLALVVSANDIMRFFR
ncbi:hypothetical protein COY87_02830 [Candidatus Roizmanbacteria bacterium CG_4_10_14_0_8_um_filter_33_9]|uniref:Peptidase M50 domain-containing protein n=1 Tax=Candidatus Roizmanbacteria bacterium CG_4_10_14_0_8_um_filter_33_9 TaxID=1974826 RepID=A0A2M7QJE2_9BACT|nr:MAG: hypothetical protein COY87_02830 [Candidatus Roizmanbacteria bacterium CG_4_10_14_0_8_um_filter_33_9]